jgi:hypothetical protein
MPKDNARSRIRQAFIRNYHRTVEVLHVLEAAHIASALFAASIQLLSSPSTASTMVELVRQHPGHAFFRVVQLLLIFTVLHSLYRIASRATQRGVAANLQREHAMAWLSQQPHTI